MDKAIAVLQFLMFIPVNMIILIWSTHRNLTIKKKYKAMIYIFPAAFILSEVVVYFSDISVYNAIVRTILNVVLFGYFIIFYTEKLSKKIFMISITFVILELAEVIVHITTMLMGLGIVSLDSTGIIQVIALTCYNFLALVLLSVFTMFYRKKSNIKANDDFVNFALVPFSQIFMYESIFLNYTYENFNQETVIILLLGLIISTIADIFLFKSIKSIREANKNKIKIAELEYNQKLAYSYYQNILQNIEQTMKYKHDFNNMISTVYTMISSGNIDESIKFLDEMKEKNSKEAMPVFCKNPVINSIIYDKKVLSENMNVNFKFSLDLPEELHIELTDLCSIFTNLVDNAFNSARASKNKTVELKVWCELGYLFVRTTNYPDTPNEILVSQKHSLEDTHGYGLNILNDISQKYDGCFNITYSKDKVMAVCSVRC